MQSIKNKYDYEGVSMEETKQNRYEVFVDYAIKRMQKDNGYAAKLRKADNPDTAYQAWDILLNFGVDITKENEMRAFSLIGAALARSKASKDGTQNLGKALRYTLDDTSNIEESSVALRLQRVLACTSQEELCLVLRPTLNFILSKTENNSLSFAQLLKEIQWFGYDEEQTQRIKLRWAQDFYTYAKEGD